MSSSSSTTYWMSNKYKSDRINGNHYKEDGGVDSKYDESDCVKMIVMMIIISVTNNANGDYEGLVIMTIVLMMMTIDNNNIMLKNSSSGYYDDVINGKLYTVLL